MPEILWATIGIKIDHVLVSSVFFQNSLVAIGYLSAPFLVMVTIDYYNRKSSQLKTKEELNKIDQTIIGTYKLASDEET